jgi:hypothetical protein
MPLQVARGPLRTFRYAMYFDGVDDYVQVTGSTSLNPGTSDWTEEAWVNVSTLKSGIYSNSFNYGFVAISHRQSSNDYSLTLLYQNGSGSASYANAAFVYDGPAEAAGAQSPTVNPFTWHNLVGVRQGGNLYIYLDGVQYGPNNYLYVGSYLSSTTDVYSSTPLRLGAEADWNLYSNGYIAQVLIYSRALSASEVQQNYLNPDNPVTDGLVLWLKADPAYISGSTWYDLSGNNNNGTIYGATLVQLIPNNNRLLQAARTLSPVR